MNLLKGCEEMKFEKIGEDRLKITLTYDDMEELDFDAIELGYEDSDASDILDELLEMAEKECGFVTHGHRLIIEVMPFHLDGLVLMITKILKEEDLFDKMKTMAEKKENQDPLLFLFDDFYILVSALKEIAPFYEGRSSVYFYHKSYFLRLLPANMDLEERVLVVLSEFGRYIPKKIYEGILNEYATIVIEKDAVKKALTM